jgi:hypothetical protein
MNEKNKIPVLEKDILALERIIENKRQEIQDIFTSSLP